jgi:hypothetical protein
MLKSTALHISSPAKVTMKEYILSLATKKPLSAPMAVVTSNVNAIAYGTLPELSVIKPANNAANQQQNQELNLWTHYM